MDLLNSEGNTDIVDILNHIMSINEQSDPDEAKLPKHALNNHAMRPALFQVLCDIKSQSINRVRKSRVKYFRASVIFFHFFS